MKFRMVQSSERRAAWDYSADPRQVARVPEHSDGQARPGEGVFDLLKTVLPEWPGAANGWA